MYKSGDLWGIRPGVYSVDAQLAEAMLNLSNSTNDWVLFQVDCSKVSDRNTLFKCLCAALPMNPLIHSDRSWDALSDSLWGGLHDVRKDKVLIILRGAKNLKSHLSKEYQKVIEIFGDVANTLTKKQYAGEKVKSVSIFLVD
ncbi:MAG TPA: hypothetical protein ENJ79_08910 [Gammaproteobacteria bacterium]|nr:hypothetical protein [Gammaproteobacteria bacterium]